MCYPASDYIIFSLRKLKFYEGRRLDIRAGVGGWINQTPKTIPVIWKLWVFVNCIFRALPVVGGAYISYSSHSKRSLAVILRSQTTFYAQRFAKYEIWSILWLLGPILAKKWVSPTFQLDHQVNPENRPSKDFKTGAVSEMANIVRSPPFLDWSK